MPGRQSRLGTLAIEPAHAQLQCGKTEKVNTKTNLKKTLLYLWMRALTLLRSGIDVRGRSREEAFVVQTLIRAFETQ